MIESRTLTPVVVYKEFTYLFTRTITKPVEQSRNFSVDHENGTLLQVPVLYPFSKLSLTI